MARLKLDKCEIIVYPFYADWSMGNGVPMAVATLYPTDLDSLDALCRRARVITRLNRYYGCVVRYDNQTVLTFINS